MPESQLNDLLADPDFAKFVSTVATELARARGIPFRRARGFVLSALGEPAAHLKICDAWLTEQTALAKVILRRRAIDLLRKDARRVDHRSLPTTVDELHADVATGSFAMELQRSAQLERRSVVRMVLEVLDCFADLGEVQRRRAALIERRLLDDASYAELSTELGVSEGALRVQFHEALFAFREHLREHLRVHDPELFRQLPTP